MYVLNIVSYTQHLTARFHPGSSECIFNLWTLMFRITTNDIGLKLYITWLRETVRKRP